jgi:hypothetical protein
LVHPVRSPRFARPVPTLSRLKSAGTGRPSCSSPDVVRARREADVLDPGVRRDLELHRHGVDLADGESRDRQQAPYGYDDVRARAGDADRGVRERRRAVLRNRTTTRPRSPTSVTPSASQPDISGWTVALINWTPPQAKLSRTPRFPARSGRARFAPLPRPRRAKAAQKRRVVRGIASPGPRRAWRPGLRRRWARSASA